MSITSFVKRIQDITRNDAGINGDAQRIEQMSWLLFLKIYDSREMVWELEEDDYESIIPEDLKWRNWAHAEKVKQVLTGEDLLEFVNNKLFKELKELEITPNMPIRKSIVKSAFEDANNYMKNGVLLRQVINVIDEVDFNSPEDRHSFMIFMRRFSKIFKVQEILVNFTHHVQQQILLLKCSILN